MNNVNNTTAQTNIKSYWLLHGFQYYDKVLQFFHISTPLNAGTSEGYVKNTLTKEEKPSFDYVYQYKDHLGNVRVSYTQDPEVKHLIILEEAHYYPFGLQHTHYNTDLWKISRKEEQNTGGSGTDEKSVAQFSKDATPFANPGYNYKFQGQEHQDEFGLNWDSFKWRNYMPDIGRFFNIDPLAEDYVYNGPYNFSENRVIDSAELEGLERIYAADGKFINSVGDSQEIRVMQHNDGNAQGLINTANNTELSSEERTQAVKTLNDNSFHGFSNTDKAAFSFAHTYNAMSIKDNIEYGSAIFDVSLTDADGNDAGSVSILSPVVKGDKTTVDTIEMQNSLKISNLGGKSFSIPMPGKLSGFAHTHGRGNNDFSTGGGGIIPTDESLSRDKGVPVYMSNKRGEVKVLDHKTNRRETFPRRVSTKN